MTNHPTPVILSDEPLAEISARAWRQVGAMRQVMLTPEERDALCQSLRVAWAELGQRERTMKFWEESYLAEHETWGNCKWKAENTALRDRLGQHRNTLKSWQRHIERMGKLLGVIAMDTEVENAVKELQSRLAQVEKERTRLLRGEFTAEEFQNLCHSADIQAGFDAFADGCEAYQQKMFGRCRTKGKVQ